MAITLRDTQVVTKKVRFSYVHVFEPNAVEVGQEEKYSVSIIIPKEDKATLGLIDKAVKNAVEAGKAKLADKTGRVNMNTIKTPLRDGDAERPDDASYAGSYFLNASSKQKPGVVKFMGKDANGKNILKKIEDTTEFYSGCFGLADLNFYAFSASGNKGIAAGLNNVIKLHDGDYLGGRASADDVFGEVEIDDEALDGDDSWM